MTRDKVIKILGAEEIDTKNEGVMIVNTWTLPFNLLVLTDTHLELYAREKTKPFMWVKFKDIISLDVGTDNKLFILKTE